jgi:hypothetical protein
MNPISVAYHQIRRGTIVRFWRCFLLKLPYSSQQLEFKTKADTRLVLISVARPPSEKLDNQISGTVWIDQISLNPENQ